MPATTRYVPARDAAKTIGEIAGPQTEVVAGVIAGLIPSAVPVVDGVMQRSYKPSVETTTDENGNPSARVHVGSPFWHWMEYGTRFNPPYRPVQRTVEALGVRYEPK